jgi:putative membrane-bound dehydrogenase-like protein
VVISTFQKSEKSDLAKGRGKQTGRTNSSPSSAFASRRNSVDRNLSARESSDIIMKRTRLFILALFIGAGAAFAKDDPLLQIGAARMDITPDYPVRLHGYGGRRTNSQGVAQHLFAKALAFGSDKQGPSILFTVDNLAVSGAVTDEVAARLKKRAKISREQIALCSSHTHSAPMLTGVAPNIFSSDIIPEQQAAIDRYTRELVDKLERVALAALSNRAPSKLSWSEGTAKFAKNRRVIREGRAQFGENDTAPVDHALATMFVHGSDGKLRAVLANYACHCTTLGGEWNQIHGDWSGYAQAAIEREHPGAVALISIGCGADANPSPRGKWENAQAHGNEIATEVRRLLALPSKPLTKLPEGKLKRIQLDFDPLPTRAQWEERARKVGIIGYHAKKNLARLDHGEKLPARLPYVLQSWIFDDQLAMVFLAGEVVVDYQRRLKSEFDNTRLWVNGYANDVPCYIPSRRILTEGGYEAEDSLWYYDRPARLAMSSEDRIVKAVHDLVPKKFAATKRAGGTTSSPGGTVTLPAGKKQSDTAERSPIPLGGSPVPPGSPPPLLPQAALKSMRIAPEFTVDLVAVEPLVIDPVAIDWGADGKLWVAEMRDYPMGVDGNWKPGGVVKFLQDTNGDGHYDKATLFLDNLPFPTGVFAWRKGVLVCAAPDILYAEDTNGDGRADVVKKLFTGFATNNYQARVNSLSLGLDNWVYGANGLLGGRIRFVGGTSSTSPIQNGDSRNSPLQGEFDIRGRDFRMNPDTGAFEPASGLTQQGRVRDDFGNWFGCDNTHLLWHYPLGDEYLRRNPHVAVPNPIVSVPQGRDWNRIFPASMTLERFNDPQSANRVTSACGLEIYRDELLGKEFYGNAFTCEPVHNLVHREVLTPDGVTFRSARATNEPGREFLASTDNRFRPVQVRTGPDGALWVVDMYRHVIEHPRWIPSNRLAQLDVRAGDDKGRIYRVYRKDNPPRALKNFAKLSTSELTAALDSPNGTQRDIVHRELLNRGDKSAASLVRDLTENSLRSVVRIQAYSVMDAFEALDQDSLKLAFAREKDPTVRAHILRFGNDWRGEAISQAMRDIDIRVRFQAVLAKGDYSTWPLLPEATTNTWMRAAVLSSAHSNAGSLFRQASWHADRENNFALVDGLFATILAGGSLLGSLEDVLPRSSGEATAWRLCSTRTVVNLWRKKSAAGELKGEDLVYNEDFAETCRKKMPRLCRQILNDRAASEPLCAEALRLLALVFAEKEDIDLLRASVRSAATRGVAIDAVIAGDSPGIPDFFIPHWVEFSPAEREKIVNGLATRAAWSDALLKAIESGVIASTEVPIATRSKLLASKEATFRKRAEAIWSARESSRARLVADYRKAIGSNGSATHGAEVFEKVCASCHALNGRGYAVGPDLATFRDKSAEDFLVAVLDPNAAIEPRFVSYNVETKDGRSLSGVIRSETANGFTLVPGGGIEHALSRSEVNTITASSLSLMPEGLEQGITPAQMNDLIAFLKQAAPRAENR